MPRYWRHLRRRPIETGSTTKYSKLLLCEEPFRAIDWLEQYIKVTAFREMKVLAEVCMELYYDYKNDEEVRSLLNSVQIEIEQI